MPVSGTLALSVHDDGAVVFEALVRPPQDGIEWSLADVATLDPATVRPDEALLVRGQLVTVGIDRDCISVPPPTAGLPNRACQSTSVLVDGDPGDAGTVHVQRDAAAQFGTTEAVYAISPRLYGGYCGDQPPCWLWDVVARLDGMSATSPSPSPTSSDVSRTIGCDPGPLFVDEAGLVESCTATRSESQDELPLTVRNPGGDQSVVEITWAGGYSDFDRLVLRRAGVGYELVAYYASPINVIRDSLVFQTQLRLRLSELVSADSVSVSFEWPSSGPRPSEPPLPPTLPMTHSCSGNGLIQLIDHAGLIESCAAKTADSPEEPIALSDASQGVVQIVYSDACAGASGAQLHLWARDDLAWPSQRPYVMNVDVQSPRAARGCRPETVGVQVDITFMNASLTSTSLASEIEAFLTADGRGIDSVEGANGGYWLSLDIAADKLVYAEGEAVEVVSSLVSDTGAELTCPFGPHIVLEQLDGPLSFASGPFILMCSPTKELRPGETITSEFSANGWGYSEPNPLEPYVRDGKLYLPPGTYRFSSSFTFGMDILKTEHVELAASVVIRVVPAPADGPKETSTTAVDCPPTFLLLDETGLVETCSVWTPEPGQSGVSQGPDASSVFVAWTYSYCRGAPFVWFEQAGDRYVFELGHLVTLPTVWPSCEPVTRTVGIAVRFKQPLDVSLIDLATRP